MVLGCSNTESYQEDWVTSMLAQNRIKPLPSNMIAVGWPCDLSQSSMVTLPHPTDKNEHCKVHCLKCSKGTRVTLKED